MGEVAAGPRALYLLCGMPQWSRLELPVGRMAPSMNREDSVLDDIDRLVDESLARGDQSDSFHGEMYRQNLACPWCGQGWHFLKITETMERMRRGSYGRDEFGQGIVDPDYRHDEDDSMILCPGSEYHGPVQIIAGVKVWDKQGRERFNARSHSTGNAQSPHYPEPSLPPGRRRKLRFIGPFRDWTIAVDQESTVEEYCPSVPGAPFVLDRSGSRRPRIVDHTLTVTFELDRPIKNPSPEFLTRNAADIDGDIVINSEGTFVTMRPVAFPFAEMQMHANNPNQEYPDWVEFVTTYELERHPWFLEYFMVSGTLEDVVLAPRQGHEIDFVTFDEAYQRRGGDSNVEESTAGSTSQEATRQDQR